MVGWRCIMAFSRTDTDDFLDRLASKNGHLEAGTCRGDEQLEAGSVERLESGPYRALRA
jgi:hypothetical protein